MQPLSLKSFQSSHRKKAPHALQSTNQRLLYLLIATFAAIIVLLFYFRSTNLCFTSSIAPITESQAIIAAEFDTTPTTLVSLLHYATAVTAPEQTKSEIRKPYEILQSLSPCNFLVFGIGHDSLMWDTFNPRGITLFLEEDPKWTVFALQRFPILHAHTVRFTTRLSQAKTLLSSYKKDCSRATGRHFLKGNWRCKLALNDLPEEVYDRDWDVIMIDGPRGFFPATPGRMSVIYSVAVMARARKSSGVTHVFLHDVDREVEKMYAKEFLCMKYRVAAIRKLWHFVIPPVDNVTDIISRGFC